MPFRVATAAVMQGCMMHQPQSCRVCLYITEAAYVRQPLLRSSCSDYMVESCSAQGKLQTATWHTKAGKAKVSTLLLSVTLPCHSAHASLPSTNGSTPFQVLTIFLHVT